jgi:hypothetical protein
MIIPESYGLRVTPLRRSPYRSHLAASPTTLEELQGPWQDRLQALNERKRHVI